MLELYKARLAHIDALSNTSLFSEMEMSILQKLSNTLSKILKIKESDIETDDFNRRIIQSSRTLHIGDHKNSISNEVRCELAEFLKDIIIGKAFQRFTVTETDAKSESSSVTIRQGEVEFLFRFSPSENPKPFSPLDGYMLSISKIDVESIGNGWEVRKPTQIVECEIGHYWNAGETIAYLKGIDQQGLRVDSEMWLGHQFDENQAHEILYEFVLHQDWSVEEGDLRNLRLYTSDCMLPTCFTDFKPTFDIAVDCLQKLTDYLTSTYSYDKYGYDHGETIAVAFLNTCIQVSRNGEDVEKLARVLLDGMSDSIDIEDIQGKVKSHINQLNEDWEVFDCYEDLEAKAEQLYAFIEKLVRECQDDW